MTDALNDCLLFVFSFFLFIFVPCPFLLSAFVILSASFQDTFFSVLFSSFPFSLLHHSTQAFTAVGNLSKTFTTRIPRSPPYFSFTSLQQIYTDIILYSHMLMHIVTYYLSTLANK